MKLRRLLLVLSVLVFVLPLDVHANWVSNGTPLCTVPSEQGQNAAASDGAGGVIVAWTDNRNSPGHIYAQRIDASGTPQWTANGAPICTAPPFQYGVAMVSDGAGGAIMAWTDGRGVNLDLYAQRINAAGVVQWATDGVVLCNAAFEQTSVVLTSDGAGGAIASWIDYRNGIAHVYMQRINASGASQWTTDGVSVSTSLNTHIEPGIVSDGAGGAMTAWSENVGSSLDIYAQRIDASGAVVWSAGGVVLCSATNTQGKVKLVADGAGGAVATWHDYRSGVRFEIYSQKVTSSGTKLWLANGVAICTGTTNASPPDITTDGAGGAIIAWSDSRPSVGILPYAQRIGSPGSVQWQLNGAALAIGTPSASNPEIVPDGNGGIVAVWVDYRNNPAESDLYAQRMDTSGAVQWSVAGVPVSIAPGQQGDPAVASDGASGAVLGFYDARSGGGDIYAQRIEARYGDWGRPDPVLCGASDNPNDQGGKVILNWKASDRDRSNQQLIKHYTIWRATESVPAASSMLAGDVTVIDKPVTADVRTDKRIVWHEKTAATEYYWELVGTQVAYYYDAYTYTASTRADSTVSSTATQYFRIAAEGSNALYNWPSNVLSAHSVDNLAPNAPLMLTALRSGPDVHLKWNRVRIFDLKNYSVYRATSTGVTPVPVNFLTNDDDTLLVDSNAPTSALYYIVTARDIHLNESTPSNEAAVSALTGAANLPPIAALTVLQNYPNPFTGGTEFMVGLPAKADIRVEVYDVAGRRVREASIVNQSSGWRSVRIDSRDDRGQLLPSGVYFYRVHAGNETVTRKMVITR